MFLQRNTLLQYFLQSTFILSVLFLSACGAPTEEEKKSEIAPTIVSVRSIEESSKLATEVVYPGTITPEQDVKITATASGNASGVLVRLGDKVKAGQVLMRIDDSNSGSAGSFNAAQVGQAQLSVNQAKNALDLARNSFKALESATKKDLDQAKSSANQAGRNVEHTGSTTSESLKTAELAYESTKLATEQAKSTLENRKELAVQSEQDTITNAFTTATSYANTAGSVIDGINTLTGLDNRNNVDISYKNNLGALDSSALQKADASYDLVRSGYENFLAQSACTEASECINRTAQLLNITKTAIDATVTLLEKTISGGSFTQTSLNTLKSTALGYQSQINTAIAQINATKQALVNVPLNNKTTIDQLEKAYSLAQKQEASAAQNVSSIRAQIASQRDQVGTAASSAQSSYESTSLKLQSQLDSSRVQVQQAELAYQNALLALQNLSNTRTITAPIDGSITKKSVSEGDAVNPGQTLFTISNVGNVKVEVFLDDVHQALVSQGLSAKIVDSNQQTFTVKLMNIAPQADAFTKRFLAEFLPDSSQTNFPSAGNIVDVMIPVTYKPLAEKNFFIPLSALTVGQNESSIFIVEKGLAKRVPVKVIRVTGEYAELSAKIPEKTNIIVDGARTVSEGTAVQITK